MQSIWRIAYLIGGSCYKTTFYFIHHIEQQRTNLKKRFFRVINLRRVLNHSIENAFSLVEEAKTTDHIFLKTDMLLLFQKNKKK